MAGQLVLVLEVKIMFASSDEMLDGEMRRRSLRLQLEGVDEHYILPLVRAI